ncbi:ATP-binding protein [Dyadobacter sp. BHUBP1]|uniref:ATP-binding protein n=1 Tax=Dyadobacter sp. BHUBP1 TaxID=3424178 RepID=UPI003D346C48
MCLLAPAYVSAQQAPEGYSLQQFTDENGLPQNSVKAIAQDRNGFIWLTTEAGLVRFDGRRFVTFEKSLIPISNNRFRGFIPFPGTVTGSAPEFYALSDKREYVGILANGRVSVDSSFYKYYKKFKPLAQSPLRYNSALPSLPALHALYPDSEHYFVTSGNDTSYIWRNPAITCYKAGKRVFVSNGPFTQFLLIGPDPYAIDLKGNLKAIGLKAREVTIEGEILDNNLFSNKKNNYRLFWNNISRQAFLYVGNVLYLAKSTAPGRLTTHMVLRNFDLEKFKIHSFYFDEAAGSLFLGSTTNGLFQFRKQDFYVNKLLTDDADNVYYAQVAGTGLSVLTSQGYSFKAQPGTMKALPERLAPFLEKTGSRFHMARCNDGSFWIQYEFDIFKMDPTGRKILADVKLPEKAKSLSIESGGRLWVGCETNAVFSVEEVHGQYVPKLRFRLSIDHYEIIGRESDETMLLATEGDTYRLNTRTGDFKVIKALKNMTARSSCTTQEGTWLATYGNGFLLLKGEKAVPFPLDEDRFLATAHCIIEDGKGFFWITTNRGLFQVPKQQLVDYADRKRNLIYYLFYDKSDGFGSNEFNGGCYPCAVTLANGTVSLPSINGLVWFKPQDVRPALPNHRIFISSAQEDGKPMPVADTLEMSHGFEQLRLEVTTPYLGHPKNIRMYYSLSGPGRTESWTSVDPDFVISIPGLEYGNYVLRIRKVTGFGIYDYTYKTVHLRVPRTWYETWWFRLLAGSALLALFVISVRSRSAYHIKKEREANLIRHYRVISQIIAAVNHDIQTPLLYIGFSLKQFNAYFHRQPSVDPLITRLSDETLDTSQRLNTLTRSILDYIKLQSKSPADRWEITPVNIAGLVAATSRLFAGIAAHREVEVKTMIDPNLTFDSDPNLLSIIIHNLIDNALKVAQSTITIAADEDMTRQITIEDDGGGMPAELVAWLNQRYQSYEDWLYASQNPGQKGIGLVIVKDLCVLLGIQINAKVVDGSKTTIALHFGIMPFPASA